jgi:transposase-like protein
MHDELTEDYRDMIYADSAVEIEKRRKAFLRKWGLKCRAVADSVEEARDRLFTFTRLDLSQWKSARTTNAIERLNGEFRRRIKTDRAALRRDRAYAALGAARLRRDSDAQARRMGAPLSTYRIDAS